LLIEFSDNQDRIFVFRLLFCIFIIVKTIKVRLMGDIIIVLLVFWVVGKLLKGVFGGFSKSSFKDDK
ncbi:hypothetical protein, partial [Bacteroides xylanisolvens]